MGTRGKHWRIKAGAALGCALLVLGLLLLGGDDWPVHKGKGIELLASQTGYALGEMLGVGDSDVDLPFLDKVGYSAALANANLNVKRLVQYVAPHPAGDYRIAHPAIDRSSDAGPCHERSSGARRAHPDPGP